MHAHEAEQQAAGRPDEEWTPTVLVVDDEELICESLRTYLTSELQGVAVLTAESGGKALDLLDFNPVDVVLADQKMPGMTGLDLLIEVRRRTPSVARVLMTAYPDVKLAQAAINEGRVNRFFTKPLDPDEVVRTVGELLAERKGEMMDAPDGPAFEAVDGSRQKRDEEARV